MSRAGDIASLVDVLSINTSRLFILNNTGKKIYPITNFIEMAVVSLQWQSVSRIGFHPFKPVTF